MRTIKVGMIGAGAIAPLHCQGIQLHPAAELVAVADASKERASALAHEFRVDRVYADPAELLRSPDIEAVSIALPNYLHAATAIAALQAGKHVLLEKPFATSAAEASEVVAAAKKSGKIFTVGMNQRFTREAQTVRELKERGELGEIYHAKAYWLRRAGAPKFGTWFLHKKRSGGGALLDIGVHMLDLALSLMGNFEVETVSGFSYLKFGNRGLGEGGWGKSDAEEHLFDVDDFSGGLIRLAGGATVLLEVSWIRHQADADRHDVELFGTEGGASVYPTRLFKFLPHGAGYQTIEPKGGTLKYKHCNRHHNWIDAILGEAPLEATLEQAIMVQRVLDALYESAASGREVVFAKK